MKIKIFNEENINTNSIKSKIVRVKALIINSKNEILLGEAFDTIQFPGGHLEPGESLSAGLQREIKEETGLNIGLNYEPFFLIKHFLKDNINSNHRLLEIYYYTIFTDEQFNISESNLDIQEQAGNFHLFYIPLNKVSEILKESIDKNPVNKIIVEEMLLALAEWRNKYGK